MLQKSDLRKSYIDTKLEKFRSVSDRWNMVSTNVLETDSAETARCLRIRLKACPRR